VSPMLAGEVFLLLFRHVLEIRELVLARSLDRSEELVQLELDGCRVAVLSVLQKKHQQKRHDDRAALTPASQRSLKPNRRPSATSPTTRMNARLAELALPMSSDVRPATRCKRLCMPTDYASKFSTARSGTLAVNRQIEEVLDAGQAEDAT